MTETVPGPDGAPRCAWCGEVAAFFPYHDEEWGFPVTDDVRLFEKLCLESFQSGLSWRTILDKRENFRRAFASFDFKQVAAFTEADVMRLLADPGIVRHRGKIEAVVNNAGRAQALVEEVGSLAAYFWSFEPGQPDPGSSQLRATSAESEALARDLKRRGWKFVGPTTVYAFMQAMGLVNDHAPACVVRERVVAARRRFTPPA